MKAKYLILILALLIVSCSKEIKIEIEKYVDLTKPFKIVQLTESFELGKENIIQVDEKKYSQLLNWLELNNINWKHTPPVSYNSELAITQEDFKLLFLKDLKAVVMSFIDEHGKLHRYIKPVKPKELKFLVE